MEYNLDFSGGENSWFDLWHTHIDWDGKGNESPELRKAYLNKLLKTFNQLKSELTKYPHEFQLWIVINEKDSSDDAVYIHSKNPNGDNFPIKMSSFIGYKSTNTAVAEFVELTNLKSIIVDHEGQTYFYLYDVTFGEPLL